jgi:hypothetical protein
MLRRLHQKVTGQSKRSESAENNDNNPQDAKHENDAENGKPHEDTPDAPVGFWDPSLKKVRNRAFGKWLLTTATLMAFILAVLSIVCN